MFCGSCCLFKCIQPASWATDRLWPWGGTCPDMCNIWTRRNQSPFTHQTKNKSTNTGLIYQSTGLRSDEWVVCLVFFHSQVSRYEQVIQVYKLVLCNWLNAAAWCFIIYWIQESCSENSFSRLQLSVRYCSRLDATSLPSDTLMCFWSPILYPLTEQADRRGERFLIRYSWSDVSIYLVILRNPFATSLNAFYNPLLIPLLYPLIPDHTPPKIPDHP